MGATGSGIADRRGAASVNEDTVLPRTPQHEGCGRDYLRWSRSNDTISHGTGHENCASLESEPEAAAGWRSTKGTGFEGGGDGQECAGLQARLEATDLLCKQEMRRTQEKGAELAEMSKLMASLEATIEQQAKISQLDQQHLTKLEAALSQRQVEADAGGCGAKDSNLLASLDEERRRADLAEIGSKDLRKRLAEADARLIMEDEAREFLQEELTEREDQLAERDKQLHELSDHIAAAEANWQVMNERLNEQEGELRNAQSELAAELKKREALQGHLVDKEILLKQFLEGHRDPDRVEAARTIIERNRQLDKLQQDLAEELSKRQRVQAQIIEKEKQLCELHEQLTLERRKNLPRPGSTLVRMRHEEDITDVEPPPLFNQLSRSFQMLAPTSPTPPSMVTSPPKSKTVVMSSPRGAVRSPTVFPLNAPPHASARVPYRSPTFVTLDGQQNMNYQRTLWASRTFT